MVLQQDVLKATFAVHTKSRDYSGFSLIIIKPSHFLSLSYIILLILYVIYSFDIIQFFLHHVMQANIRQNIVKVCPFNNIE